MTEPLPAPVHSDCIFIKNMDALHNFYRLYFHGKYKRISNQINTDITVWQIANTALSMFMHRLKNI